jgi:hypothetical protein
LKEVSYAFSRNCNAFHRNSYRTVAKCRTTGSVLDKNKARKEKSTNPGKASCYWYSIPEKSLDLMAIRYGMSGFTIHADTKLLKVPPYKTNIKHEFGTASGFRNLCLMLFLTQTELSTSHW